MTQAALERLKDALKALKARLKSKREDILARLARAEAVSQAEQDWVDNEGNTIEEDVAVQKLDAASDYERALERMSSVERAVVEKLLAEVNTVTKQKRKEPPSAANAAVSKQKARKKPAAAPEAVKPTTNASIMQKVEALAWMSENSSTQSKTVSHMKAKYPGLRVSQAAVSGWLKEKATIMEDWNKTKGRSNAETVKRSMAVKFPEIDEMLELWVAKANHDRVKVSGGILREKWKQFADLRGVADQDRLDLSEGWLTRFKARAGLKEFRAHGEAGSANMQVVLEDRDRICRLIRSRDMQLRDIFNMDETGLFYSTPPDRGRSQQQMSGLKGNKTRITYAFCMNADGTEKREPFVIGRSQRPRCFKGRNGEALGFYYRWNAKAWMTGVLYTEWLKAWNAELQRQDRHILLFVDNFSGHTDINADLTHIDVSYFSPKITSHVQPADAGIIRCFKAHYRRLFNQRAVRRYDANDWTVVTDIYKIDVLEAMRMAARAWDQVDEQTIRNCWRKSGILPPELIEPASTADQLAAPDPAASNTPAATSAFLAALAGNVPAGLTAAEHNHAATTETLLSETLDALQQRGILHARNRPTIDETIDPAEECCFQNDGGDVPDIFTAVMEQREIDTADASMEPAQGDDPLPTRQELLRAIQVVQCHAAASSGTAAQQVQHALEVYAWDQRAAGAAALVDADITHFFRPLTARDA